MTLKQYQKWLKDYKRQYGSTHQEAIAAYNDYKKLGVVPNIDIHKSEFPIIQSNYSELEKKIDRLEKLIIEKYSQPINLKCEYPPIQFPSQQFIPSSPFIPLPPQGVSEAPIAPRAPSIIPPIVIQPTFQKLTDEEKEARRLRQIEEQKRQEELDKRANLGKELMEAILKRQQKVQAKGTGLRRKRSVRFM